MGRTLLAGPVLICECVTAKHGRRSGAGRGHRSTGMMRLVRVLGEPAMNRILKYQHESETCVISQQRKEARNTDDGSLRRTEGQTWTARRTARQEEKQEQMTRRRRALRQERGEKPETHTACRMLTVVQRESTFTVN